MVNKIFITTIILFISTGCLKIDKPTDSVTISAFSQNSHQSCSSYKKNLCVEQVR